MSRVETVKCDECGKQKQDSNRWWYVVVREQPPTLAIAPSHVTKAFTLTVQEYDACSEQCVHSLVSKWMRGELK